MEETGDEVGDVFVVVDVIAEEIGGGPGVAGIARESFDETVGAIDGEGFPQIAFELGKDAVSMAGVGFVEGFDLAGGATESGHVEGFESTEEADFVQSQGGKDGFGGVEILDAVAVEAGVEGFEEGLDAGAILAGGFLEVLEPGAGTSGELGGAPVDGIGEGFDLGEHFAEIIEAEPDAGHGGVGREIGFASHDL